jgi:hypothetical protein
MRRIEPAQFQLHRVKNQAAAFVGFEFILAYMAQTPANQIQVRSIWFAERNLNNPGSLLFA